MEYEIIYSARKTIAIQITKNCDVVVRAPYGASMARIKDFVSKHEAWVASHLEAQKAKKQAFPEPTEAELEALTRSAKETIPERVAYFSEIMGVSPSHISINRAKTRFGSCSQNGRINFSCRLMRYPSEAIDYVVVHELAHLVEMNHSAAFYKVVASVLPDYKERKKLLK